VLSGRGLCDELITRPEESYRLWCVVVCDLETLRMGAPKTYDISSLRVNDLTLILQTWRGHAVAQLVEALSYKSEGRGFHSRLCH
jgi:hypothetical protein